jgi:hypothetical protein
MCSGFPRFEARVTAERLHRIAHWTGIALTLPVLAAAALGIALWLDGLPPTFTAADGILVLGGLGLAATAAYGICRGLGYAILWLFAPARPLDRP